MREAEGGARPDHRGVQAQDDREVRSAEVPVSPCIRDRIILS
jgi:hypothetical protein